MRDSIKTAFVREISLARAAYKNGLFKEAFTHLERAHILSQPNFSAHWRTHWWMLKIGLRLCDFREIIGQLLRLAATIPGYVFGWVPLGNTGGSNVSALQPMPIPDDLNRLIGQYNVWRDVRKRLYTVLAGSFIVAGLLGAAHIRHLQLSMQIEDQWKASSYDQVRNLGTVSELEITPVVNWSAGEGDFKTEPGVSYFIKTERQTILFDLGFNQHEQTPSPLEHNLSTLGIDQNDIDTIFISHAHRDHVGGVAWEQAGSFSLGQEQADLSNKKIYTPVTLTYPSNKPVVISKPTVLSQGIASTGPIARQLFIGRIDEQALVINLKNKGLVLLVGCGHQTLDRLLALIDAVFEEPLYAIVGDLHYPVPEGRLHIAGVDVQRRLASGGGPFKRLGEHDVEAFANTVDRAVRFIALGGHDTSDEVLERMQNRLKERFQAVRVGEQISIL
ncbi:MAG: DUF3703 domain-containing protein [Pseudomonadales bacterium]